MAFNDVLLGELEDEIRRLPMGGFVVLQYTGASHIVEPYSQLRRLHAGFYCEVVSEHYIDRDVWPIDRRWLAAAGWLAPSLAEPSNWWRIAQAPSQSARALVDGLVRGRRCPDPEAFLWYSDWPSPGGGGEPGPQPALRLVRAS